MINLTFMPFFNYIAAILLYSFKDNPKLELVAVMIIAPMFVNVIQFWWTDSFIQKRETTKVEEVEILISTDSQNEEAQRTAASLHEQLLNNKS